ncbi:hypothetical protein K1719_025847 [Acacia pycnantha]|nr:hypothetical protein K1719_025847 [Acacia pycnantha]
MRLSVCEEQHRAYCHDHFLFAKVVSPKRIHASKIQALMNIYLSLHGPVQVVQHDLNYLVIHFQEVADRLVVPSQGSWLLQNLVVAVFDWQPETPINDVSFSYFHAWIQVNGLPLDYYTMEVSYMIGSLFGEAVDHDQTYIQAQSGLRVKIIPPERIIIPSVLGFHLESGKIIPLSVLF